MYKRMFQNVRLRAGWATFFIVIAIIAVMEMVVRLGWISPVILVAPSKIGSTLWELVVSGEILPNLVRTLLEILASDLIAVIVGIPIGFCFWSVPLVGRVFEPYLVGLYAMPLVLFYPFLLVVFGLGATPIIIVAAAMGLVPIILNSWAAFHSVPDIYFKVSNAYRCTGLTRFRRVIFPAAAPLMFAGFKLCLIYSFIGVIVMEFMTGNIGLGFQVAYNYQGFKVAEMYAYVVIIIVVAAAISYVLTRGEKGVRRESWDK